MPGTAPEREGCCWLAPHAGDAGHLQACICAEVYNAEPCDLQQHQAGINGLNASVLSAACHSDHLAVCNWLSCHEVE
jgi:hypothetical protein